MRDSEVLARQLDAYFLSGSCFDDVVEAYDTVNYKGNSVLVAYYYSAAEGGDAYLGLGREGDELFFYSVESYLSKDWDDDNDSLIFPDNHVLLAHAELRDERDDEIIGEYPSNPSVEYDWFPEEDGTYLDATCPHFPSVFGKEAVLHLEHQFQKFMELIADYY